MSAALNHSAESRDRARQEWALRQCAAARVRLTPVRRRILLSLARQRLPVTLAQLARAERLAGRCDPTTVYRTLMLFAQMELVRQIRLPNRLSYFTLNAPGERLDYLICRRCGALAELPALAAVRDLEEQVRAAQGYSAVYHELEIYGVCPSCQRQAGSEPAVNKLPARFR